MREARGRWSPVTGLSILKAGESLSLPSGFGTVAVGDVFVMSVYSGLPTVAEADVALIFFKASSNSWLSGA